jgi:hypothetical protein
MAGLSGLFGLPRQPKAATGLGLPATGEPQTGSDWAPNDECATSSVRDSIYSVDDTASVFSASTSTTCATNRSASTSISQSDFEDQESPLPKSVSFGAASPTKPRSRRTRNAVSNRSQPGVHAARLQRSATALPATFGAPATTPATNTTTPSTGGRNELEALLESRNRAISGASVCSNDLKDATAEQGGLTKMAFAEQQRWITVQQKTFTKW